MQGNYFDSENLRFELLENGKRTRFVYHNGELLHEEGREEGQTSYHVGLGIDAFRRNQQIYYFQQDEQLSTAFITNEQGIVQNSYRYDAFGNILDSQEQTFSRILYTGQQYDELAEQYYLRARYYNPVLGRFMQEDVYQGDGLNLYVYCKNNPVTYFDPSGYSTYEDALKRVSSMSYEDIVTELWNRRNEYFNNKKTSGSLYYSDSPLLDNELQAVLYDSYKVSGDNLAVHHMPSAHSIVNLDGISKGEGACSCVMTETHYNTFTCGMGTGKRPDDVALYEALSYEDRVLFDQYDLMENYKETRQYVDMDEVELRLQEEYKLAMEVKENQETQQDQMKGEDC